MHLAFGVRRHLSIQLSIRILPCPTQTSHKIVKIHLTERLRVNTGKMGEIQERTKRDSQENFSRIQRDSNRSARNRAISKSDYRTQLVDRVFSFCILSTGVIR